MVCDNFSVGVIIKNKLNEILIIERKKFPFGFAMPAGHIDDFSSPEECAIGEVKEEVGLDVESLNLVLEGEYKNPCRREGGTHHYWYVFEATVGLGEIVPSQDETKQVYWCSKEKLKELAKRTERYKSGNISDEEWEANPGLEKIWYTLLKQISEI